MKRRTLLTIVILFLMVSMSFSQDNIKTSVPAPDATVEFAMGFNYDYLKSPLRLSFDYPKGYFGMNIPLKYSMPKELSQQLFEGTSDFFAEGDEFDPRLAAKQAPNTTIKVDVPMLNGVLSFSYITNMNLQLKSNISMQNFSMETDEEGAQFDLKLDGIVSVPLDLFIGWESMTFGYAYQVNEKLSLAFNLHRHTFEFDLKGKIDVDLRGPYEVNVEGYDLPSGELDYSLHNVIDGHYDITKFTPTFALKFWRVSWVSRLGMKVKPKGHLQAKYTTPFFINPNTFEVDDLTDQTYLIDNIDNFLTNATKTVDHHTTEDLSWEMPQAHTLMFDIIPEKLSLSYTKLFGKIALNLQDSAALDVSHDPDSTGATAEALDFGFSASVDHMIILEGNFYNAFFNLGVMSLDFGFGEDDYLLSSNPNMPLPTFGNGVLMPILNVGAMMGSKLQVLAELDILPLVALKTGLIYYF